MNTRFVMVCALLATTLSLVGQELPVPDYTPKPLAVSGVQVPVINLNGEWNFCPDPGKNFWQNQDSRKQNWKPIRVPGEWGMQGFKVETNVRAAYRKEILIPSDWNSMRIILKCDGLYSDARIYLNGKLAGTHQGGFTPAEFDLTTLARPGKNNQLVIGLISESLADTLASASQYAAHQLGGITRKLELFAIPETHIGKMHLSTDLDPGNRDAYLNLAAGFRLAAKSVGTELEMDVVLIPPKSGSKEKVTRSFTFTPAAGVIALDKQFSLKIFNPDKWDPEHPNLYNAEITLKSKGRVLETVNYRFGFKETVVAGNQVFVNGKPIKLRGVCRHEVHPTKGRSLTMEEWKEDIRLFKEANVNYIRTSHYPPAEEFIALCDSAGFFVELESPLCWVGHGANIHWAAADPHEMSLYQLIRQLVLESVGQYRNHPSVLIWSMANESQWGPIWDTILQEVNRLDPTRPVSFHDQAFGGYNNYGSQAVQIANFHYPGPSGPEMAWKSERPLLFGEYCHLNCYNRQETITDPGVRDDWGRGLERMWENMYHSRGNLGGAIWSGIDDIFFLPDGRAVGYGEWGPIDGWRRPKPEYWHLKKTYSPVKIGITSLPVPQQGQPVRLGVENRNLFTNLGEMEIRWKLRDENGTGSVWAEPGQTGLMVINPKSQPESGDFLEITIYSPQKYLVDSYLIRFGPRQSPARKVSSPGEEPELLIQGDRVVVTSGGFEWVFSAKSGELIEAGKPGQLILAGNPDLQMLPLTSGPCVTDYKLDIQPLNDLCSNGRGKLTGTGKDKGKVVLTTAFSYDQADLELTWTFDNTGVACVEYTLKSKIDINPRQVGLVFTLPGEFRKLAWEREAQWTIYPDDHIGRQAGTAVPFPAQGKGQFHFGVQPSWPWSSDFNSMGSNDFKATRENIWWAELKNSENHGLLVVSDGKDAVRCWVDNQSVYMLVATFFTGGGDLFFSGHHEKERKPLKTGDALKGVVKLSLK